jgi:hypothetical protein
MGDKSHPADVIFKTMLFLQLWSPLSRPLNRGWILEWRTNSSFFTPQAGRLMTEDWLKTSCPVQLRLFFALTFGLLSGRPTPVSLFG